MGWIHPTSWALYTTIEILKSFNSQKGPPVRLNNIYSSFNIFRGAWCLASGLCLVLFSVPGIYVETYLYDDVYKQLPITSDLRQKYHPVRYPYIGSSGANYFFPS